MATHSRETNSEPTTVGMPFARRDGASIFTQKSGNYRPLILALVSIGCALRLLQFIANPAQWVDELSLSSNVVSRPMWELLTTRLDNAQSAPPGVLAAERLAYLTFGNNDLSLRSYAFACSLAALYLFYKVTGLLLRGVGQPVAMALFATAVPLVLFASQAKQYSSDVMIALALSWLGLGILRDGLSWKGACIAGPAGIAALLFSQPALFALAGISLPILWNAWQRRHASARSGLGPASSLVVLWGASCLLLLRFEQQLISKDQHDRLYHYWAAGFMPTGSIRSAIVWILESIRGLFLAPNTASLMYPEPWVWVLLACLGGVRLCRRETLRAALVLLPFAVTLSAAVLHLYPFADRLILFLVPTVLLCVAEAIGGIVEIAAVRLGRLGWATLAVVLLAGYPITAPPPPYFGENIKPPLRRLQEQRRPGDAVYVYYGAVPAVRYYGSEYGLNAGEYDVGVCSRGAPRKYLRELDNYRGRARLWVIISHALQKYGERETILHYLDAIGTRRDSMVLPPRGVRKFNPDSSDLYLYDLSDTQRLGRDSAATFDIEARPAIARLDH